MYVLTFFSALREPSRRATVRMALDISNDAGIDNQLITDADALEDVR